jgi:hypothetical protein
MENLLQRARFYSITGDGTPVASVAVTRALGKDRLAKAVKSVRFAVTRHADRIIARDKSAAVDDMRTEYKATDATMEVLAAASDTADTVDTIRRAFEKQAADFRRALRILRGQMPSTADLSDESFPFSAAVAELKFWCRNLGPSGEEFKPDLKLLADRVQAAVDDMQKFVAPTLGFDDNGEGGKVEKELGALAFITSKLTQKAGIDMVFRTYRATGQTLPGVETEEQFAAVVERHFNEGQAALYTLRAGGER